MYKSFVFLTCVFASMAFSQEEAFDESELIVSDLDCAPNLREIQEKRKKERRPPPPKVFKSPEPVCPPKPKNACVCEDPSSHLQVGGRYRYTDLQPDGFSSLTGHAGGAQGSYEYQVVHQIYEALSLSVTDGSVSSSVEKRSILDIDTQARVGYTFGKGRECWLFSLFTGLGYRHMGQRVSPTVGESNSLYYNTFYVPLGFLLSGSLGKYMYAGLNFQWRPQVYPTVRTTPLKGARWITTYQLENVLVELPLTAVLSRKHDLFLVLKPFFEHWQDGRTIAESEAGISLDLPGNTYLLGGVELNFAWSF